MLFITAHYGKPAIGLLYLLQTGGIITAHDQVVSIGIMLINGKPGVLTAGSGIGHHHRPVVIREVSHQVVVITAGVFRLLLPHTDQVFDIIGLRYIFIPRIKAIQLIEGLKGVGVVLEVIKIAFSQAVQRFLTQVLQGVHRPRGTRNSQVKGVRIRQVFPDLLFRRQVLGDDLLVHRHTAAGKIAAPPVIFKLPVRPFLLELVGSFLHQRRIGKIP